MFIPLVWGWDARWAALHREHVDGRLSCGKKATETQEGANRHCRCRFAILQKAKREGRFEEFPPSQWDEVNWVMWSASLTRQWTIQMFLWSCFSHRCMFLHTLKRLRRLGARRNCQLHSETCRHAGTHTHTQRGKLTNYYKAINKVHAQAQTHYLPCCGSEKACTIVWRGCRQHSGQRGVNPGTVAHPLCCSLWLTPPPLLGRTWLHRK